MTVNIHKHFHAATFRLLNEVQHDENTSKPVRTSSRPCLLGAWLCNRMFFSSCRLGGEGGAGSKGGRWSLHEGLLLNVREGVKHHPHQLQILTNLMQSTF